MTEDKADVKTDLQLGSTSMATRPGSPASAAPSPSRSTPHRLLVPPALPLSHAPPCCDGVTYPTQPGQHRLASTAQHSSPESPAWQPSLPFHPCHSLPLQGLTAPTSSRLNLPHPQVSSYLCTAVPSPAQLILAQPVPALPYSCHTLPHHCLPALPCPALCPCQVLPFSSATQSGF